MNAYIKHISYYVPKNKLTNDDLARLFPGNNANEILKQTGIKQRGVCLENELSSDLAVKAGEVFFNEHPDIKRSDIEFLIFCTQTPDYITPSTACLIQDRLGLYTNIGAYDLNLGCSSFVYALSQAKGLIETNQVTNVLILNCEAITKVIHPGDKAARMVFGDAAVAILVSAREEIGIKNFVFGTNGKRADIMMLKAGKRHPSKNGFAVDFEDEYGNISSDAHFYMKGTAVFSFAMEVVPKMVKALLQLSSKSDDDIDYYIFHQANLFVLKTLQRKLKIPDKKFCINLVDTGNTVGSTIPIAFKDSLDAGLIKKGDNVILVSFGVGLSWAASTIIV